MPVSKKCTLVSLMTMTFLSGRVYKVGFVVSKYRKCRDLSNVVQQTAAIKHSNLKNEIF